MKKEIIKIYRFTDYADKEYFMAYQGNRPLRNDAYPVRSNGNGQSWKTLKGILKFLNGYFNAGEFDPNPINNA